MCIKGSSGHSLLVCVRNLVMGEVERMQKHLFCLVLSDHWKESKLSDMLILHIPLKMIIRCCSSSLTKPCAGDIEEGLCFVLHSLDISIAPLPQKVS